MSEQWLDMGHTMVSALCNVVGAIKQAGSGSLLQSVVSGQVGFHCGSRG